jgi:hypothetical protein
MTCKQEITQEFKIGDRVKVVRQVPSNDPNGMGSGLPWHNSWNDCMDGFIGEEGVIEDFGQYNSGVNLGGCFNFPISSLELVVEPSEGITNTLTIESFLRNLPDDFCYGVCYDDGCFIVKTRDEDFVAATEERLQEIMKALLVLYKGG